ncbi:hypothetical protein A33M_2621 [Rhodovulum sp. PH10]|uniref:hypothetical protein n=1 Tax=Rhodovulum sp. PH10 TaxID=1187851 RepID=UPI00027C21D1|nr:hypothetical protein [Rhodovulum sp. PH10]EJW11971.1 hypothetical protein A33M_2621 [Rhodovulum sp. PH10]
MTTETRTTERKEGGETVEKKTVTVKHQEATKEEKRELDQKLDEALEESFPGSDPVSISQPTRHEPKT